MSLPRFASPQETEALSTSAGANGKGSDMTTPEIAERKKLLRDELRRKRSEHAANLPSEVSALVFNRPPEKMLAL